MTRGVPLRAGDPSGPVRVGETVRRPRHARSEVVQGVLGHLAEVGFDGAPRPLGFDELDREVVAFVPGHVPSGLPFLGTDAQLVSATRLVRRFHDAMAGSAWCGEEEVVCHGDLGPHNTVFDGDMALAIIDWDAGVAPGRRVVDFAHAVWCFADLTEDGVPVHDQARRLHLMCDAYPGMEPAAVVAELAARFRRARDEHEAASRARAVRVFDRLLAWMDEHGPRLLVRP